MATERSNKNSAARVTTLAGFVPDFDMYFNDTSEAANADKDKPVSSAVLKLLGDHIASQIFKALVTLENPTTDFVFFGPSSAININGSVYTISSTYYAYFNNQIYKINTGSDTLGVGEVARLVLSATVDGQYKTLDIEGGTSGTGIVDYDDIIFLDSVFNLDRANSRFTVDGDITSTNIETGIEGYIYDLFLNGNTFDFSSQTTGQVPAVCISRDGTKFYLTSNTTGFIYQYNLSTAYDISTASYSGNSLDISSIENIIQAMFLKDDGTKMFIFGTVNNIVYELDLSTAYDISTGSKNSNELDPSSELASPFARSLNFNTDGTKVFVGVQTTPNLKYIYQYTLSTAWDISTSTYDSVNLNLLTYFPTLGVTESIFSDDGLKLYVKSVKGIYVFYLTTAFDLSSVTLDDLFYGNDGVIADSVAEAFCVARNKLYYAETSASIIYEYTLGSVSSVNETLSTDVVIADQIKSSAIILIDRDSDPANPQDGNSVIWQSDGTDSGDAGDIMIKIRSGSTTKTATLIDFSAV